MELTVDIIFSYQDDCQLSFYMPNLKLYGPLDHLPILFRLHLFSLATFWRASVPDVLLRTSFQLETELLFGPNQDGQMGIRSQVYFK